MKNWKQWTFVSIIALFGIVIGFIACDNGNNDPKTYTVTIGALTNGNITANPTSGIEGTEITLMVNPDNIYRLKAGTLKHGLTAINETSLKFNLPASDVTITAEFISSLIGTWEYTDSRTLSDILTIFEETYTRQDSNGKYWSKGTWAIETPNKFILIVTHSAITDSGHTEVVDDLPKREVVGAENYTFEFIPDSYFILTNLRGNEYIYRIVNKRN